MGEQWRIERKPDYPQHYAFIVRGDGETVAMSMSDLIAERIVADHNAVENRAAGDAEREAETRELKLALWYAKIRLGICAARMRGCNDETGKHELLFEVENFEQEAADALKGWHPDPFFDKSTAPRADAE